MGSIDGYVFTTDLWTNIYWCNGVRDVSHANSCMVNILIVAIKYMYACGSNWRN